METDTLKLNRKEVERAMGKAAEMFGTENDWMCELIEIAMLPAVQDWTWKSGGATSTNSQATN
jgi:hypothetical protein